MKNPDYYQSASAKLERKLRLQNPPLAVKLLKKPADVAPKATRPQKDLGYRLMHCQMFSMSRRSGMTVAMLKEDMFCYEPVVCFGIGETPGVEYFMAGNTRYPDIAKTPKAAKDWAGAIPRFEPGEYIGIMSAPLESTGFVPDLILIYCNSLQLSQLAAADIYDTGRDIVSRMSGAAACVYASIPAMQSGQCTVTLPCGGDRIFGGTQADELIFSIPAARAEAVFDGLDALEKVGYTLPIYSQIMPEPVMPKNIRECQKLLGIARQRPSEDAKA